MSNNIIYNQASGAKNNKFKNNNLMTNNDFITDGNQNAKLF